MSGHVLYVRCDNAGDMLLQGPAIRAIAAGSGQVTALCGPAGRAAAELLPGVDRVIEHSIPWIVADADPVDPAALGLLTDELAELAVDRAIISTSWHQSPLPMALILRNAGIPWIGAISDDYPGSLLDLRHRVDDPIHEVERALSLAAASGFELADPANDRLMVDLASPRRLPGLGAPGRSNVFELPFASGSYVVVHPGASSPSRAWAPELNAALVELLRAHDWKVAITGASAEIELTRLVSGEASVDDVADLGGRTTFAELAEVIGGAAAIVTGNTGPMHVAAAMQTPVACLYAQTVPSSRWHPWRVEHDLLGSSDRCENCSSAECRVPGHPCIDSVSPEAVFDAVSRLTDRRQPIDAAGSAVHFAVPA